MSTSKKMTEEELVSAHRRYVLSGLSLAAIAEDWSITGTPMRHQWQRLELPLRDRGGRFTPAELTRICQVHGLTPAEIVGNPANVPDLQAADVLGQNVRAQTSKLEPVVVFRNGAPVPFAATAADDDDEQEPTATAVATTDGRGLTAVNEQLAALQSLLAMAEARSVTISGTISVQLTAEVEI